MEPTVPSPSDADLLGNLRTVSAELQKLTAASWAGHGVEQVKKAVVVLEQIHRSATAIKSDVLAEIERSGSWRSDGDRTLQVWVKNRTGSTRNSSYKAVSLSKSLSEDLPATRKALAAGAISEEHAQIIARECTKSPTLKEKLTDPHHGENMLLEHARRTDATTFTKTAKEWAITHDPKGEDRQWRRDLKKEELTVVQGKHGWRIHGWLTPANGTLLTQALDAHMGRKSADDSRSLPERQAAAALSLAHQSLDAGFQLPNARIRPHLTITMGYETLERLAEATGPSIPATFGADTPDPVEWAQQWRPGDDHAISTELNYDVLRGVAPATLPDGTPLPPSALARFACNSLLSRVIFGPDSTVLDSGREERIFTASQTRAIIARDRHCKYPGCEEPPSRCEIHHSLEWFKHQGTTHVDLGVLLCWHHHTLVHQRTITITRTNGAWTFTDRRGAPILQPESAAGPPPRSESALGPTPPYGPAPPLGPAQPSSSGFPPTIRSPLVADAAPPSAGWPSRGRRGNRTLDSQEPLWTQPEVPTSPDPPF